jgi:hypothetical protein
MLVPWSVSGAMRETSAGRCGYLLHLGFVPDNFFPRALGLLSSLRTPSVINFVACDCCCIGYTLEEGRKSCTTREVVKNRIFQNGA